MICIFENISYSVGEFDKTWWQEKQKVPNEGSFDFNSFKTNCLSMGIGGTIEFVQIMFWD